MKAVHREREHIGIVFEEMSGAVSLVNIQIDHGSSLQAAMGAKLMDCNRDIIEDAEPCAFITKSMMRPPGESTAEASSQGILRRAERAAHGCERAAHQSFRPREADAPHYGC